MAAQISPQKVRSGRSATRLTSILILSLVLAAATWIIVAAIGETTDSDKVNVSGASNATTSPSVPANQ